MPEPAVAVETIRTVAELVDMEPRWQSLFQTGCHRHIANSYPYVLANASERRRDADWSVHYAHREGVVDSALFGVRAGIAKGPIRISVFQVGTEFVGDILTSDLENDTGVRALLETILARERTSIIDFGMLTEPAFLVLRRRLDEWGMSYTWGHQSYGYVSDTTLETDALYRQLGKKSRRRIRHTRRRLGRDFQVAFNRLASEDVGENLHWFERFLVLEAAGWKGREGTSIASNASQQNYYRAIVETAARQGALDWCALMADGTLLAMSLGLRTPRAVWVSKIAYNEDYAHHSPGTDLVHQIHLDCIDDPDIDTINWITAPEYLSAWRPSRCPYYHLRIFDGSIPGRGLYVADSCKLFLRRTFLDRGSEAAARERRFL
jgi:hypothetical protein